MIGCGLNYSGYIVACGWLCTHGKEFLGLLKNCQILKDSALQGY
jgi:hypothetical protein